MTERIGILGGTFDPPHIAHLIIANEVYSQLGLEKIIFLPNSIPPHKRESGLVSAEQRVQMLKLATGSNPHFEVDPRELYREGKSFSYDTMREMVREGTNQAFYFIIGGDMVEYLPKWYKIEELLKLVTFVGVNRPNYSLRSDYPVLDVKVPEMDISSSFLRTKLRHGEPIDYYVPEKVADYIKEHQLYEPK
ncbi:nicotinic acid mononucleotide adenylyltransferase [Listeria floridensis FSL S10-1187]|uniref:Probable nicotinate-nucleotide adenylyltransferase n=1 Tax=Listeria floridensis FSL S10-1187 TaxID=1265817 RepID=A0ABN0RG42_9LIST|nr:nicotinate-nucleotide adenylyltransferase [Listeria floridensis]EUJ32816.1 nicotinic acid mononucleotide adenylyltransferase [Listeria floridensis FSL S10-1187]